MAAGSKVAAAPVAPTSVSNRTSRPMSELAEVLGYGQYGSLARKTGLSRQQVSRVMKGLSGTPLTTARQLAKAAGVTLDEMAMYVEHQTKRRNGGKRRARKTTIGKVSE
jgi:transcriptional regulator with XRE-family HTH domain